MSSLFFKPLAFDSFSVRSMATMVKTDDIKLIIDPGIALGPLRYGLEPSVEEEKAFDEGRERIMKELKDAEIVTISHYHFDHHPFYEDKEFNSAAYKDKIILTKDYETNINLSQKKRAYVFRSIAQPICKELRTADNKTFNFGNTELKFSEPVYHGKDKSRLGFVLMLKISFKDNSLMHCSDIQGPMVKRTADIIIKEQPKNLIIGGPPTYLLGYKFSWENLKEAEKNVLRIIEKTPVKNLIIDHHLLRDLNYKKRFKIYDRAQELGCTVKTAAEYLGIKNLQLEARRRELSKKTAK